jgi:hypothetical protein
MHPAWSTLTRPTVRECRLSGERLLAGGANKAEVIRVGFGSSVFASTREDFVAIARIVETRITAGEYDQMRDRLGVGDAPPPGGVFHVAALGEDGKVRVVEVWDSRAEAEAWGEKVMAVRSEAGFGDGPPSIEYLEVHNIVQR